MFFPPGYRFEPHDLEELRRTLKNKYALASKLTSLRRDKLEEFKKSSIQYIHGGNFLRSADECPVLPLCMAQPLLDTSQPGSVKDMDIGNDHEVLVELGTPLLAPTVTAPTKRKYREGNCNNNVLLIAAILASLTFRAGLSPPVPSNYGALFLWLNSAVFVASEAMIAFLARELPLKPWLLVSVFSLFGTYVCSIITTFPHTALTVLFAGSPLLVFVAASGHVALHTIGFLSTN